jgi:hypothetical protein
MKIKEWFKVYIFVLFSIIFIVATINYIIDPHWSFSHKNSFNQFQFPFNERQQKSNMVSCNGLKEYDGILIGSSRATFINQNDFYQMNIYNYALDSIYPFEYKSYIDFAKRVHGGEFKYIIIGADFYNTQKPNGIKFKNPAHYISNSTTPIYRYKMLFSMDSLKKSLENIEANLSQKSPIYYNRDNIKFRPRVSEEERIIAYKRHLKIHIQSFLKGNYQKNPDYIRILRELKESNPNTKFIIYTSPISANLLVSIIQKGERLDDFKQWLNDMVDIFGEVYHFMTINSITKNLQNYPDDDHFYPYIGTLLANKISKKKNINIPNDFGILLTKKNINKYLKSFEKELKQFKIRD